eukprot:GHVQ01001559.1.p1 GENE.GHVQ01001559.1~~GHVQ01001559.1.p1  ORF type:complete len:144 (-),score=49.38 GHVQ01001559.1:219-650(-)
MIQQYIYTAASSVCTVIHISVLTHFVQIQTRGEETSSRLFYTSVSVCSSSFSCDLLTIILSLTHTYTHTDTHTPTHTHTHTHTDTHTQAITDTHECHVAEAASAQSACMLMAYVFMPAWPPSSSSAYPSYSNADYARTLHTFP